MFRTFQNSRYVCFFSIPNVCFDGACTLSSLSRRLSTPLMFKENVLSTSVAKVSCRSLKADQQIVAQCFGLCNFYHVSFLAHTFVTICSYLVSARLWLFRRCKIARTRITARLKLNDSLLSFKKQQIQLHHMLGQEECSFRDTDRFCSVFSTCLRVYLVVLNLPNSS